MGRSIEVPITPSVLRWAIEGSGYNPEQIAEAVGVRVNVLEQWAAGDSKPTLTHVRKLASKLHRPLAALLLPAPPESRLLPVQFRHPIGEQRKLNPEERRHLRRAARFQEVLSWLTRELEIHIPRRHSATLDDDPVSVANIMRNLLGVSPADQKAWANPAIAFDQWRAALETTGHVVFLFPLGKDSCRGFSLWDDLVPIVAINTAWNEPARIFTLFHEMAHLVTRTNSACEESVRTTSKTDSVERWCERFAADFLMPARDVESTLRQLGWQPGRHVTTLSIATKIAALYKVSLRAAVIRLIELDAARWTLYDEIPPTSDRKPPSGGGTGRNRKQIREDQLGERATSLLVAGVEHEILSRSQAVEFLDIPEAAFDELTMPRRRTK